MLVRVIEFEVDFICRLGIEEYVRVEMELDSETERLLEEEEAFSATMPVCLEWG
jgi:hypothetical protein